MIHITIASLHNRLVSKRNQSVFYCLNSAESPANNCQYKE